MRNVILKTLLSSVFTVMALCTAGAEEVDEQRTFTAKDGRKLEATVLSTTETAVTLKRTSDGQAIDVPLANLSTADVEN